MSDAMPDRPRGGRVVTFYSYKGGTGRTMALANIAWILASNGYRVLAADWDLESPGLHRFFAPFLDQAVDEAQGIIDMVRDYEWDTRKALESKTDGNPQPEGQNTHITQHARIQRYTIPLRHWTFPEGGSLEFLSPGKQNKDYLATLSALDWDNFYHKLNGGAFLDALREELRAHYDYALIDSRTGLSDIADICTVHLPDVLVDCFTLSNQGVEGAARVARSVQELYGYRIRVLPVPMRVDPSEKERADLGRMAAQHAFEGLPADLAGADRRLYWANVEVPYRPYYAYEEMLAVFGDMPDDHSSMLSAYERITAYITDGAVTSLPIVDEGLRNDFRGRFYRRPPLENRRLTIEYLPQDHIWAEWIMTVLIQGEFDVREHRLDPGSADISGGGEDHNTVSVVSEAYLAWRRGHPDDAAYRGGGRMHAANGRSLVTRVGWAVSVLSVPRPLEEFAPSSTIQLGSARDEEEAVDRLKRHLSFAIDAGGRSAVLSRFPGSAAAQRGVQLPIGTFTGRDRELHQLRTLLRSSSTTVVRPVALVGTAGMGKTSIALEYVHRYMNDYDLVGWIPCGPAAQIDLRVAELESVIADRFGRSMPTDATVGQRADAVISVLSDGETVPRWLLVYDNAEDIDTVLRWMPAGGGRVLITSQSRKWDDHGAVVLTIDKFARDESLAYLLREVSHLTSQDAGSVADKLGDMPLALAAAAAHLNMGYPVSSYLSELELPRSAATGGGALSAYPDSVVAALLVPLQLLRERAPAAFRLLQLCSVMAPEIGLPLVYSNAMAEVLRPFDAALVEPMIMRRVVKDASDVNLLTADPVTNMITMHRVVHGVVSGRMTAAEAEQARAEVRQILLAARPRREVDDPATWSRFGLIWPHLARAEVVSSDDERVRQLIIDRVRYLYVFGDDARGVEEGTYAAERWGEMLKTGLDPGEERTLRTQLLQLRFNIGNCLRGQSKFTESRALHARVLEEQAGLLGKDHPHTLMTAVSLAADLRALGLYADALTLDRQTYPSWVGQFGDDNLWSLRAANNLAVSCRLTGHVNEALDLDRKTYERLLASLPEGHALTFASLRNLARDLLERGEYRAAVDASHEAYQKSARLMGADSAAALEAQVLLGIAIRSAGKPKDAIPQFEGALDLLRARLTETGSATLACRLSYSVTLLVVDRVAEAEAEIRPVLAAYRTSLGANHPYSLVCQTNLAAALRQQREREPDKVAEAAAVVGAALDGLERVLGPEHPYTLAAAMVDSVLRADQGQFEWAAQAEARTAAVLARTLGSTHPDTLRCRANLLLTRRSLGEDTTADLAKVIEELELILGADHPTISTLRENRRLLRALDPQPF
jgi:MinD-like ATPase involved in chromosome partitioning or flagellar assembly/tetratricopeptide (TPR) repeat protein